MSTATLPSLPETPAGASDGRAPELGVASGSRLPRRRVVLELKIGADNRERMIEELYEIAAALRNGNMWGDCLMGGHSAGYTVSASEDESVTHDSYFAALEAMASANMEFRDARRETPDVER